MIAKGSVPPWRVGLLRCPIKDTSSICLQRVDHHQVAAGIEYQGSVKKMVREPHGLVEVFVAINDGAANITRYCLAVCTSHFVALEEANQRQVLH